MTTETTTTTAAADLSARALAPQNAQSIAALAPQNMQSIAALAPQSYKENSISRSRCLEAGSRLLDRADKEGMTDALDMEIAHFIEKAKATVRKMNGRRSPVTQIFDQIRRVYTTMESDVDPSKAGSVPYKLQLLRDAFAKMKHDEEERRRRELAARQAKENAKARYRADVETDLINQFNTLVNQHLNALSDIDSSLSLSCYDASLSALQNYRCELPDTWCQSVISGAHRPAELSPDECRAVQADVMSGLALRFREQFPFEVGSMRDDILDRLPSKKKELVRIAEASAEEAARIKAEMQSKERQEAARKEAERIEREKQQAAAASLAAEKQEMDSLFGAPPASPASYQPRTQVKKKIVITSADDVMKIVAFWWSQEGCRKSVEELSKEFRKQVTYANAAANSKTAPVFISDLTYTDDVKAK